jgi:hypothetical protein
MAFLQFFLSKSWQVDQEINSNYSRGLDSENRMRILFFVFGFDTKHVKWIEQNT